MPNKVLIVGGAGLVGQAVVSALRASGFSLEPVVVDIREPPLGRVSGVKYHIDSDFNVFRPSDLDKLFLAHRPIAVIDTVNIASIASRSGDLLGMVTGYFKDVIASIARHKVAWVDVGTVATGGMGVNIPFTHNEATPDGNMAPGLVLKLEAAAAHGGLLDILGRTPEMHVGRVVPRGMIGFEKPFYGPIPVAHLQDGQALRVKSPVLRLDNLQGSHFEVAGPLKEVGCRCGENGVFGQEETRAITAPGMMETVTAEHVAHATLDVLSRLLSNAGCFVQHDVHPGPTDVAVRQRVVRGMQTLAVEHKVPSVAFGNLGPFLTTQMWELWAMRFLEITPASLVKSDSADVAKKLHSCLDELAYHLPGLGIPVITGAKFIPAFLGQVEPTAEEIAEQVRRVDLTGKERLWAVDLRRPNMDVWIGRVRQVLQASPENLPRSPLPIDPDSIIEPGKLWAAHMAVTGHGRPAYSGGDTFTVG